MRYHSFVPTTLSGINYAECLIVNLEVILRHVRFSCWKNYSTLSSVTFSFSCGLCDKKVIQSVSNNSVSSVTAFLLLFSNGLTESLLSSLDPFFFLNNVCCSWFDFYTVTLVVLLFL